MVSRYASFRAPSLAVSITDSIMNVRRPLDSFPILRSGNLEEIRQGLIKSYKPRRLNFPHRAEMFELYANHWQSQSLGLSYLTGVPFQLEFPTADFFWQAFILGGADIRFDRTETRLTNGATCVLPPDSVATAAFNPGYEHFGLRIKADALLNKLAALIDATPSRKLVFDQTARVDDSRTANIRRLVTFLQASWILRATHCRRRLWSLSRHSSWRFFVTIPTTTVFC